MAGENTDRSIEKRIKNMLVRVLDLPIDPSEIEDDEMLFGGGLGLDSMATLEMVFALEDEFGIEVSDEDLKVELFDSVTELANYARDKLDIASAYRDGESVR